MTREQMFLESPITARYNKDKTKGFRLIAGFNDYNRNSPVYIEHIINTILFYTGRTLPEVVAKTRAREIVYARHLCFHFLCVRTRLSLKTIGQMFGGRDHTTVIHGRETIKDLCECDEKVNADYKAISELM